MICVTDCMYCKNELPNIDGWKTCCKAFPSGHPLDFDYTDLRHRKECGNGVGFEPKEEIKNIKLIKS